jgi:hypothetical protein
LEQERRKSAVLLRAHAIKESFAARAVRRLWVVLALKSDPADATC